MSSRQCPRCSRPLAPGAEGCPVCGKLDVMNEPPRPREDDYVLLPEPEEKPVRRRGPRWMGQPLWGYGVACIVAGGMASTVLREMGPVGLSREEALGQAVALLLFFLTGVTLIIVHWAIWLARR